MDGIDTRDILSLIRQHGRPRVSLDIDVTMADIYTPMIDEHNKRNANNGTPTSYTTRDMLHYDWSPINSSWPEMKPLYDLVWTKRNHEIELLADTALVHQMNEHYEVNLVTTKDDHVTTFSTKAWLRRHGLNGIPLMVLVNGEDRSAMNYQFYIDDNPGMVAKVRNRDGKVLFVVTNGTNRNETCCMKKVIRMQSSNDAMKVLIDCARSEPVRKARVAH